MFSVFFKKLYQKNVLTHLVLIVCAFSIYSFYYYPVLFHPNNVLSKLSGDTLKNYYTFIFHARYAENLFDFKGFNYPFGDHIVYTDGQPLLSILLHCLPFCFPYLIGILHVLLFASYIINPSVCYLIFKKLGLPGIVSGPISIAITLLSPQLYRIYAGHFALAYTCLIPLFYLLLLSYCRSLKHRNLTLLCLFNFLLFFLHPYYGLGFSIFSVITLFLIEVLNRRKTINGYLRALVSGALPIAVFQFLMKLSDHHLQRPKEPFGSEEFKSTLFSYLLPYNGPFKSLLNSVFGDKPSTFEGYSYLGFALLLTLSLFILIAPFFLRYFRIRKDTLAILLASLFFMLLSLGLHLKLLHHYHISIPVLNQFRSVGRFSWFFYFSLPLLFFPFAFEMVSGKYGVALSTRVFVIISGLYLILNLFEANSYFTLNSGYWSTRNIFNYSQLNDEEKFNLTEIQKKQAQVILPLPIFYIGSEVLDRNGADNSLIISTLYSYHSGLPILSSCASRSSLTETRMGINFINSYLRDTTNHLFLKGKPAFVICTNGALLPDEKRLLSKFRPDIKNDSLQFGYLTESEINKPVLERNVFAIHEKSLYRNDSLGILYVPTTNKSAFLKGFFSEYETFFVLDSNSLKPGDYIISLHFHPFGNTYHDISGQLIVTKKNGSEYIWQDVLALKVLSGFYNGFGVLERETRIEKNYRYEFMIHGGEKYPYRISHFLIRPLGTGIKIYNQNNDTLFNNFPDHLEK